MSQESDANKSYISSKSRISVFIAKDGNIEPPEAKNLPESKLKFEIGIHEQENIDYFNPPSEKLTRLVHLFHIDTDEGNS